MSFRVSAKNLNVGDIVMVWWSGNGKNQDIITNISKYTGICKDDPLFNGAFILHFLYNRTPMTALHGDVFTVVNKTKTEPVFCINCKYCSDLICRRPSLDLVTGASYPLNYECSFERSIDGKCGPEGKFYESKSNE